MELKKKNCQVYKTKLQNIWKIKQWSAHNPMGVSSEQVETMLCLKNKRYFVFLIPTHTAWAANNESAESFWCWNILRRGQRGVLKWPEMLTFNSLFHLHIWILVMYLHTFFTIIFTRVILSEFTLQGPISGTGFSVHFMRLVINSNVSAAMYCA